ncbi:MAG TPA: hypothetical protein ENF78_05180 [Candidatus Bathyarchaeota archaeon]|nr:hypothetical protein [Candidatus Bathyarchaeota archaeon]
MADKEGIKDTVLSFLRQMGVEVIYWDPEGDRFVLPYNIEGKDIMVYVLFLDDYRWVVTLADLYDLAELPEHVNREAFYRRLLSDNFMRYETRYGIDFENHLVALAEMRSDELEYENFSTEFAGVLGSAAHFITKIAPELGIPL